MSGERWEDMPDGVEAAARAHYADYDAHDELRKASMRWVARYMLTAAAEAVPVVPVRVLRQWIEQERRVRIVPTGYDHGANAKLDALSRVLDDYEKENEHGAA